MYTCVFVPLFCNLSELSCLCDCVFVFSCFVFVKNVKMNKNIIEKKKTASKVAVPELW